MIRVAFDVGGVLSKRPEVFVPLLTALEASPNVTVYVLSDMHPHEKIIDMMGRNGVEIDSSRMISADYATHGELCKSIACEQLKIDLLIDDFPGYVATGNHVRLLVMPDPERPYYADEWETDGSEGDFGRRKKRTDTTSSQIERCGKSNCARPATGKVRGDLFYHTCDEHREEIEPLTEVGLAVAGRDSLERNKT